MTNLEQSFVDLCAKHDLTGISVGMNLKQADRSRFDVDVHFDGYSLSGYKCAIGHGATLEAALNLALTKAHTDRKRLLTAESLPNEALEQGA